MATFNPATSEIAILFYKVLLRMAQFPATLKKVSSACPKCPTSTPSNFKIVNTVERQMHWSAIGVSQFFSATERIGFVRTRLDR